MGGRAEHHGENHIHIAATLARQDGRRARLDNDFYRIGEALRDIEKEYGLQVVARADRTAADRPTRARAGESGPGRPGRAGPGHAAAAGGRDRGRGSVRAGVLRRAGPARAAGPAAAQHPQPGGGDRVRSGPARRYRRDRRADLVWRRQAGHRPEPACFHQVFLAPPDEAELAPPRQFHAHLAPPAGAGTSCNFPGRASFVAAKDRTRWGQNFFANDLGGAGELGRVGPRQVRGISLPKLRARWPAVVPGPGPGPGPGRGRPDAARSALRHQIARCAAAFRSEAGFFTGLRAARLLVRTRPGPDPDRPAGYAVTLPGLTGHRDGTPAWYGGGTLDPALALGVLRRRWQPASPASPAAALLDHAAATAICQHAAAVADDADPRLRDAPPGQAADIARAAADILYAAADATGNRDLRAAADGFGRAARAPWGPVPAPTPPGNVLRTAAYLITATAPGPTRRLTRHALTRALAGLAAELARLRHAQQRLRQADAARTAAVALTAASHTPALDPDGLAPPIPQATARAQPAARRWPTAGPPKRGRSR